MGTNVYRDAHNAIEDAEREWIESGSDQAKAEAPRNECPCCMAYNRPGMIWNAGAWLHCPMCNTAPNVPKTN